MTNINRGLIGIFIAICFLFLQIQSQEAYAEMKKVSGNSKQSAKLFTDYSHADKTVIKLDNYHYIFTSAESDWDKAKVFRVLYYLNPTNQGDEYTGCLVITHQSGDQIFVKYEGAWKWTTPRNGYQWILEEQGRITGGDGKFEMIKGLYRAKGKGDREEYAEGEWEIEYEIASSSN